MQAHKDILFDREEIGRIEVAQPGSKMIFSAMLKTPKWKMHLATTRFGGVQYIHPQDGHSSNWVFNDLAGRVETRDQFFAPKWVTDFSLLYYFSNQFSLSLGGNNIFNVYPDAHRHSANISNGLFIYSRRVQQFGVMGAFWYGQLNFRF